MTTTINASPTNGIVQTADGSGVMKLQSNGVTTNALAWVNFNGVSGASPVIRSSYNVSSVTRTSTGAYTVSFSTTLTDANYAAVGSVGTGGSGSESMNPASYSTTSFNLTTTIYGTVVDRSYVNVAIFGN